MKVIFLDIDGVLNSKRYIMDNLEKCKHTIYNVDPYPVQLLKDFLEHHNDCKLVISSSWRRANVYKTIDFFNSHGLDKLTDYIVGVTPRLTNGRRGDEIKWFTDNSNTDKIGDFVTDSFTVDQYAILDDNNFDINEQQMVHLVKTDNDTGLQEHHIELLTFVLYGH